jgi:hypothetical protein
MTVIIPVWRQCGFERHQADIACRRLAELSRSVTRHHRRVWQARCPTGQTRELSPGPRDAQQRYDAVIGTRPPKRSWSRSFAPGDTFLLRTHIRAPGTALGAHDRGDTGVMSQPRGAGGE